VRGIDVQLSIDAVETLKSLNEEVGLGWNKQARTAGASDDLLHVIIADGVFTTKIDGWIHAATVTTPIILKYASETNRGLDLQRVTSWTGVNSAIRYAIWQTDFHWKLDTRLWQYLLYGKFMRRSYRDAILECNLNSDDKRALLEVCDDFWDEVEIAYSYRMEIIERSRGFAPHPDKTAGSKDHGYTYKKLVELEEIPFEQLPLDFIGSELGAGTSNSEDHRIPRGWPKLDNIINSGVSTLALEWLRDSQKAGLANDLLCVKLGERDVPTRFNGWESGIDQTLRFLKPYSENRSVNNDISTYYGLDLKNYAVRFAICQSEFQRRLNGYPEQLIRLVECQIEGIRKNIDLVNMDESFLNSFGEEVMSVIESLFSKDVLWDEEIIPELGVVRPIHPRFAPIDPLEPLPWETKNQDRYLIKMKRLGYTI
jgi:hypothetical protein